MQNVGGPSVAKRRLLGLVVCSKLLYAASVWSGPSLNTERNKNHLNTPLWRTAIRIIRAYRTVSDNAALVLAGLPPADLQARKRARICANIRGPAYGAQWADPRIMRTGERTRTLEEWARRWSQSSKVEWTRTVIPDLLRWLDRTVDFQLTFHSLQALTGHGCFKAFLHRIGRAADPWCEECQLAEDTAEHTLMDCPSWSDERLGLLAAVGGRQLVVGDLTDMVCGPILDDLHFEDISRRTKLLVDAQRLTNLFKDFIENLLGRKEMERVRQRR